MASDGNLSANTASSVSEYTHLTSSIYDCISDVHAAGSFATFGSLDNFVLPGVVVDEIGAIRLPLSSDDAHSLIRVSRQAPFGKGNQTLIDETVRKTWEIDGSKVSFSNKAWHAWLDGVVQKAAEELGVAASPNSVRAELYKMLLYEKGAMFKPHKDTEKASDMFGTLVICLPSQHTGGAVHLKHGQEEKTFDTADLSAFNTSFLAWYADVTHEIEPIVSGYRWVLTYNLINTSSNISPSAAGLAAELARFSQLLSEWRLLDDQGPLAICYALDHQYTDGGLKLGSLKGNDYHRVRYVADACSRAGDFCVLLASIQLVTTVPTDEGDDQNLDPQLRLKRIVHLEGFVLGNDLVLSEDNFLQQGLYNSREPDSQRGGEYLGNQHAEIERFYNNTGVLIVPKVSLPEFFVGSPPKSHLSKAFLRRSKEHCQTTASEDIREMIVQTCQHLLTLEYRATSTKDGFLGQIASAAVSLGDPQLFRKAVDSVTDGFDKETFFELGELISFQTPVIAEEDLIKAFSRMQKLHRIVRCLQQFNDGFSGTEVNHSDEHQMQDLANWIRARTTDALKSSAKAYPQDAAALIEIAKKYDDLTMEQLLKSFISRFVGDAAFVNGLAVEILCFLQSSSTKNDLVARLFRQILDAAASQFKLQEYSSHDKWCTGGERPFSFVDGDYPYSSWRECGTEEKGRRDASIIVSLHQQLLQADGGRASELLRRIQSESEIVADTVLKRLVIPLLEQMIYVVARCPLDAHEFYQSMLTTYITRVVGKEPKKPSDWARPGESGCSRSDCSNCQSLREFLLDPKEESRKFDLSSFGHIRYWVLKHCDISQIEDKSATKQTVVATKNMKDWEWEHSKWEKRAVTAQKFLKGLPQDELKQCLGQEKLDDIMDLRMVKLDASKNIVPQKRSWWAQ